MPDPKLTAPRRLALLVAAEGDRQGREVRVSNRTSTPTAPAPTIYWQTARWLIDEGLAVDGLDGIRLTTPGRALVGKVIAGERPAR